VPSGQTAEQVADDFVSGKESDRWISDEASTTRSVGFFRIRSRVRYRRTARHARLTGGCCSNSTAIATPASAGATQARCIS
jgi:hypothetical protein